MRSSDLFYKLQAYSKARRRTAAPPQAELSDSDSDGCFFRESPTMWRIVSPCFISFTAVFLQVSPMTTTTSQQQKTTAAAALTGTLRPNRAEPRCCTRGPAGVSTALLSPASRSVMIGQCGCDVVFLILVFRVSERILQDQRLRNKPDPQRSLQVRKTQDS